jgi:hypothetical protein
MIILSHIKEISALLHGDDKLESLVLHLKIAIIGFFGSMILVIMARLVEACLGDD